MNKLKMFRQRNNISQSEVSKAIEITSSYYGMLETGVRTPSLEVAQKLSIYFNTSIEELFFA